MRHSELVSVLNFMYHGEVSVAQDDLDAFLAAAEELSVKGLTTGQQQGGATKTTKPGRTPTSSSSKPGPLSSKQQSSSHPPAKRARTTTEAKEEQEVDEEEVQEISIKDERLVAATAGDDQHELEEEGAEDFDPVAEEEDAAFEAYEGYDEQDNADFGEAEGTSKGRKTTKSKFNSCLAQSSRQRNRHVGT